MPTVYEGRAFECFYDQDSGRTFADVEFRRCVIESSSISITRDPRLRSTIRNVNLFGCEVRGCTLNAAVVEDVLVDGLKTHGLFQAWGAVFKHVTMRGKIGEIMISPAVATGMAKPQEQRTFDEANAAYYESVDWALDITEAEFSAAPDFRRVPAQLIRRDHATQVVVRRVVAMQGAWRGLEFGEADWGGWIDLFLQEGDADLVLVAPKRHRRFREYLDGLNRLRDAGVADPD